MFWVTPDVDWVRSGCYSTPQDSINELLNCVLQRFSEDYALTHPVAEEKGKVTGRGKEPPQGWIWVQSGNTGYSQGLA